MRFQPIGIEIVEPESMAAQANMRSFGTGVAASVTVTVDACAVGTAMVDVWTSARDAGVGEEVGPEVGLDVLVGVDVGVGDAVGLAVGGGAVGMAVGFEVGLPAPEP